MEQYLKSSSLVGSFGFISNLITIEKYGSEHKKQIEEILKLNIFNDEYNRKYNLFEVEILALAYHEITHFLDFTTTSWGIEYQFRKSNYIKTQKEDKLDVFRLNYIEITMHDTYKEIINKETDLSKNEMKHYLQYDENIGGMIKMTFSSEGTLNLVSSINMRCLIESHAYITEILIKIRCIECEPDANERKILMITLEKEFNEFLSNVEFIEYNMLIVLAKKCFKELSLKELSIFLKTLFLRVLDFGMESLSSFANLLDGGYINKEVGAHISQEIRRGHCRHIVAFKMIISIYNFTREELNFKKLKIQPFELINDFLNQFKIPYFEDKNIHGYFTLLKIFEEKDFNTFDTNLLIESINKNRPEIETLYKSRNISDICLIDMFLNDSFIVKVPNRVDIDISEYSDNENILLLDKLVMKEQKRFHLSHGEVIETYKEVFNKKINPI